MLEIEIKLPINDSEATRERLLSLGFTLKGRISMRDSYFDNADGYIRSSGQALRIRENTDLMSGAKECEVNFKGRKLDSVSMSRSEYETSVADADVITEILRTLGYSPVEPEVYKIRDEYTRGDMNACIDEVRDLGYFLELEIVAAEEAGVRDEDIRQMGIARIEAVLDELGYAIGDTVTTSYLGMLQGIEY